VLVCFPRPEVRFRPLPTCGRRILAYTAYDPNSGSGLSSNRKNLPTPRDSISFLNRFLSSQPVVRYRPSLSLRLPMRCRRGCGELASAPDSPPTGVPWKLPKNECVVHPADFQSISFSRIYLVCFQSSADRPQVYDENKCKLGRRSTGCECGTDISRRVLPSVNERRPFGTLVHL